MIVGLVSTYNEGSLAAGAVESLLSCCKWVEVCEGPIAGAAFEGPGLELGKLAHTKGVYCWSGEWKSEAAKRNAMLVWTRRFPPPVWGLYLDGDELLIGGRWIPDLIDAALESAAEGSEPAALQLLRQESNGTTDRLYRIFRIDLLVQHVLSMSQFLFQGSSVVQTLGLEPYWLPGMPIDADHHPPLQGEPHIYHRSHYRSRYAQRTRLGNVEQQDFERLAAAAGMSGPPGTIPREAEGGFAPLELGPEEEALVRELTDPTRPRR